MAPAFLPTVPLSRARTDRILQTRHRRTQSYSAPVRRRCRISAPPRAALGGAVLSVSDLRLQAGTRDLVHIPRWSLTPGTCIGLVGPNGAGKSTVLKALADKDEFGRAIQVAANASLGYLPQQAVSGSQKSVWEEAGSEMTELREAEAALREAERTAGDAGGAKKLERAMAEFERAGGYDQDERIARVLSGLGFAKSDWERKCADLSGGWQMRVALARLLLREPTVLLLDEPSNHLDVAAKAYLARYLKEYQHTVVLVSHDSKLLDGCCSRIAEIDAARFAEYPGCNYSKYLEEKEARMFAAARAAAKTEAEAAKLELFITRFGAKATKAKSAQSKQKALDKLLAANEGPAALSADDRHDSTMRLRLPPAPPCARESVFLENADVGYDVSKPIVRGVTLTLERGMRIAVVGANGSGKSTLLKTLAGKLPPLAGSRRVGDNRVKSGVFTQDLAADLPAHLTALQHLEGLAPELTVERIRATLGAVGIRGPAALREMKYLSGGEQARVALASFVVQRQNVLFADEISNHLDEHSVFTVCDALMSFEGALVIVSHDRRVIESVAPTHCLVVDEGRATLHHGVPKIALDVITQAAGDGMAASDFGQGSGEDTRKAEKEQRVAAMEERKETQRRVSRAQKRLPKIHTEIEKLEEELGSLETEMAAVATDAGKAMAVQEKVDEAEQRVEELYDEMQTLELFLEEVAAPVPAAVP